MPQGGLGGTGDARQPKCSRNAVPGGGCGGDKKTDGRWKMSKPVAQEIESVLEGNREAGAALPVREINILTD